MASDGKPGPDSDSSDSSSDCGIFQFIPDRFCGTKNSLLLDEHQGEAAELAQKRIVVVCTRHFLLNDGHNSLE